MVWKLFVFLEIYFQWLCWFSSVLSVILMSWIGFLLVVCVSFVPCWAVCCSLFSCFILMSLDYVSLVYFSLLCFNLRNLRSISLSYISTWGDWNVDFSSIYSSSSMSRHCWLMIGRLLVFQNLPFPGYLFLISVLFL